MGLHMGWLLAIDSESTASIGIGAMIVFIAMVLVAGIAASVLVQTSSRLETQGLKTGHETISEVASGIKVEAIDGLNTSGRISKITVDITSNAGSPSIDLAQVVFEISDSAKKYVLTYGGDTANASSINGNVFDIPNFGDAASFDIIVYQDADESCGSTNPVINFGDHVALAVNTSAIFNGLEPRKDVNGLIIPEEGSAGTIGFTTPPSLTDKIIKLQ
jgi:flagellin FlaB